MMKARRKDNDEIVAIKMIKRVHVKDPEILKNEVGHLIMLDHPNIVKLYEVYENEEYLFMVQE